MRLSPALLLNATVRLRRLTLNAGLSYGPHPRHVLDDYVPRTPRPGAPALLFFPGGGWTSGSRAIYRFVAAALAAHGVRTLVADYRLHPEIVFPAFLHDCARAAAFAARHIAPAPLFLGGHSAGAYNAAMVALQTPLCPPAARLRGVIGISGPYDFLPMQDPDVIAAFDGRAADPATQPIVYVSAEAPPMLLIHGLDDRTVAPDNSIRLAEALRARGATAACRLYKRRGHAGAILGFAPLLRHHTPILADVLGFIDQHSQAA